MRRTFKMKTKRIVLYGLFIAIILLMAFTPIGYIKMPFVEITLITIPVIVGAVTMGPVAGLVLGTVFGLTSFAQCFGMSKFGTTLFSINPFFTFIICVVARALMGYLCGVIFKAFEKRGNTSVWAFGVSSVAGALLNTLFFVGFLLILFGNSDYIMAMRGGANVLAFLAAFVGINGLVEAIACGIVGTAISKALHKVTKAD